MNKSYVYVLIIMLSVVSVLASCASKGAAQGQTVDVGNTKDVPDFFLNPPKSESKIYGVGTAKMARLDLSRKMAVSRARDDIAFQVRTQVESSVIDYAQESGAGENSQLLSFAETISRQIANTTLQGTQLEEVGTSKDGTVYVLLSFPRANVLKTASQIFSRNEDAAFAEFKAKEALKKLDAKLGNKPTE